MTTDRETTVAVRSWIADGVDRLPDRVLDAVLDQVPATPQRRPRWQAWTMPQAPAFVKLLAPIAAVVLVAVIGFSLLPGGVVTPTPTPTPSPTATPSPTPTPIPIGVADGKQRPAGTYRVGDPFSVPFTITFPAAWTPSGIAAEYAYFYRWAPDNFAPTLALDRIDRVYADPCHPDGSASPPPGDLATVDGVIEALSGMAGFNVGPVTETTVGGYPAKTFILTNSIDTETATQCTGQPLDMWVSGDAGNTTNQAARDHIWVVDVNGSIVTIDAQSVPNTPANLVTETESIVAGLDFNE